MISRPIMCYHVKMDVNRQISDHRKRQESDRATRDASESKDESEFITRRWTLLNPRSSCLPWEYRGEKVTRDL